MKRLLLPLLFLLPFCLLRAASRTWSTQLNVSTQEQFDALDGNIKEALRRGSTDITVILNAGTYYFGQKHVNLSSANYSKASITIQGNGATLVAKDLGKARDWQDGCFDPQTCASVERWSTLTQTSDTVQVVDQRSGLCRLRLPNARRGQQQTHCDGQYLNLTMSYDSKVYPIQRRDRQYVYFTVSDLHWSTGGHYWSVNHDVQYAGTKPRFRTLGPEAPASGVRFCQASTCFCLSHSALKAFTLRGVSFCCNNGTEPLLVADSFSSDQLLIEQCAFQGIRGLVIKLSYTPNALIQKCTFTGCYASGIESHSGCRRTRVLDCTFRNHGLGMQQNFGIICRGEDFEVSRNTFRNFTYSAIGVGVWYGNDTHGPCTGTVSSNDISFDQDYYDHCLEHTLMDGGAIYTWTKCDDVTIRSNRINRYRGVKDYRGIFCDDGTRNVTLENNVVSNIGGGAYCIDLRWVDHVTQHVKDHNTGCRMSGNQVDGPVRFETSHPN